MIRCQNSQGPSSLFAAFAAVGFLLIGLSQAFGQNINTQNAGPTSGAKPLNLFVTDQRDNETITTTTDSKSAVTNSPLGPPSVTSLDDALDLVESTADDQNAADGTSTGTTPTTNMAGDAVVTTTGQTTTLSQSEAGTVAGDDSEQSVTIGLRKVQDVGLAAIGVRETQDGSVRLDELIWRGTPASKATFLFGNGHLTSQSRALSKLSLEVVAREAVPPIGANLVAQDLVRARLDWLAAAGRSHDLAVLAKRLPDDDEWLDWKKWLVEYQLMQRHDGEACATVNIYAAETLDPYWHKLRVICSAVQADTSSARFGADILEASGVDDPVFFTLMKEMLNGVDPSEVDSALVEPLHVVLMDAAHHDIDLDSLATLPPGMAQGTVALRYMDTDARLVSTFDNLEKGLITADQASKLWRSAALPAEQAVTALTRHHSGATSLNAALSWRAIAADKTPLRLLFINQAMATDISAGNGLMMLPLYAGLAREAMSFPGLDVLESVTDGQPGSHVMAQTHLLLAINDPRHQATGHATGQNVGTSAVARDASTLLLMLEGESWNARALANLGMWDVLPILEATGMTLPDVEWLDLMSESPPNGGDYTNLSPVLMRALTKASEKRHVAETVLLASWAVGDTPLHRVNPQDGARIVRAMDMIGQAATARAFAAEIIRAHLLQMFRRNTPSMADFGEQLALLSEAPVANLATAGSAQAPASNDGSDDALTSADASTDTDTGIQAVTTTVQQNGTVQAQE